MPNLENLIADAVEKSAAARKAAAAVCAVLKASMSQRLPEGIVIDLRTPARDRPEFLVNVQTIGGNDHGTHLFRIERLTGIDFDANHPHLARWEADATPISEKTGKDMNGAVARARPSRGPQVHLSAAISVHRHLDETPADQIARMVATLTSPLAPSYPDQRASTSRGQSPGGRA